VDSEARDADETSACAGAIVVARTPFHAASLVSFPRKFSCVILRGAPRSDQGVWMPRRMLVALFVLFVCDVSGSMLRKVEGTSKDELAVARQHRRATGGNVTIEAGPRTGIVRGQRGEPHQVERVRQVRSQLQVQEMTIEMGTRIC